MKNKWLSLLACTLLCSSVASFPAYGDYDDVAPGTTSATTAGVTSSSITSSTSGSSTNGSAGGTT